MSNYLFESLKYKNDYMINEILKYVNNDTIVNVNKDNLSTLILACFRGRIDVVEILLKIININEVNEKSKTGISPLITACFFGYPNIVEKLLSKEGIDVNVLKDGETVLMMACSNGHTDIVKMLLLKEGINVNAQNKNGETALMMDCSNEHKHTEIVEMLLNMKKDIIDVNTQKNDGETALMMACCNRHTEIVKMLLLKEGIDVNVQDQDGETALDMALSRMNIEIVDMLLEKDAEIDIESKKRLSDAKNFLNSSTKPTDFISAINPSLLVHEIEYMIDKMSVGEINSILMGAYKNNYEINLVNYLLKKDGIDVNTHLTYACINKNENIVKMLLEKGAKVNEINDEGDTTLILTYKINSDKIIGETKSENKIVKMLLNEKNFKNYEERVEYVTKKNKKNETALKVACERNCFEENFENFEMLLGYYNNKILPIDFDSILTYSIDRSKNVKVLICFLSKFKLLLDEKYPEYFNNILEKICNNQTDINTFLILLFFYSSQIDKKNMKKIKKSLNEERKLIIKNFNNTDTTSLLSLSLENKWDVITNLILENGIINLSYISNNYQTFNDDDKKKYIKIFEILLDEEISQILDDKNSSKFFFLTDCLSKDILTLIIDKKINLDRKNEDGKTCLMNAAYVGNLEIVEYLLKNGANINEVDNLEKQNVLNYAMNRIEKKNELTTEDNKKYFEVMKFLINKNVEFKRVHKYNYKNYSDKSNDFEKLICFIVELKLLEQSFDSNKISVEENDVAIKLWKECLNYFAEIACWVVVNKILKYFTFIDKDFVLTYYNNENFITYYTQLDDNKTKYELVKFLLLNVDDLETILNNYSSVVFSDDFVNDIIDFDVFPQNVINIFFEKTDSKLEIILPKITDGILIKGKLFQF